MPGSMHGTDITANRHQQSRPRSLRAACRAAWNSPEQAEARLHDPTPRRRKLLHILMADQQHAQQQQLQHGQPVKMRQKHEQHLLPDGHGGAGEP